MYCASWNLACGDQAGLRMCCAAMGLRASAISAPPKVKIATSATRIRATVQCRVLVTGRLSVDMARL